MNRFDRSCSLFFVALPFMLGLGYLTVRLLPMPPCLLRSKLSMDCAMCGGTRATAAWHRGHWDQAFELNALVCIGIGVLWLLFALGLLGVLWPKAARIPGWLGRATQTHPYALTALIIIALLGQWVWANWLA